MTELTNEMYAIFDQSEFSFKKIKETHTTEEVQKLKSQFKNVWQIWKQVNQKVASILPEGKFAKVHVESWTNGWNLRDHYWANYRLETLVNHNPCIGVMLDKKQLQIYLMFQHYKSEERQGSAAEYNKLLEDIPEWSKSLSSMNNWYLWNNDETEFADHLQLTKYLTDNNVRLKFDNEAREGSFLIGKFAFRKQDQVSNMEEYILSAIKELLPLYEKLA